MPLALHPGDWLTIGFHGVVNTIVNIVVTILVVTALIALYFEMKRPQ
jgi:hypothetical protein